MAYNNSRTIPYGVDGSAWSFRYQYQHQSDIKKRCFNYFARFDKSAFKSNYVNNGSVILFKYTKINTQVNWLWLLYNKKNFTVWGGTGISFDAELSVPTKEIEDFLLGCNAFGKWNIALPATLKANYSFFKIKLENIFTIPVLSFGHFMEYQFTPSTVNDEYYSYFAKPNAAVLLNSYLLIDNELKVSYPIGEIRVSVSYLFTYGAYNVDSNTQKYIQQMVSLGMQF